MTFFYSIGGGLVEKEFDHCNFLFSSFLYLPYYPARDSSCREAILDKICHCGAGWIHLDETYAASR